MTRRTFGPGSAGLILGLTLLVLLAPWSTEASPSARPRAARHGLTSLPLSAQGVVSASWVPASRPTRCTAPARCCTRSVARRACARRLPPRGSPSQRGHPRWGSGCGPSATPAGCRRRRRRRDGRRGTGSITRAGASASGMPTARSASNRLHRREPVGRGRGRPPDSVAGVVGNLAPTLTAGGHGLDFQRAGKPIMAYRGLAASDARGRSLRAWLVLRTVACSSGSTLVARGTPCGSIR
jgi:hypothetical protein